MANMQIQKTKTITKTAIDQKQSLDVVQTMIHGGVCPMRLARSMPDNCTDFSVPAEHSFLQAVSSRTLLRK